MRFGWSVLASDYRLRSPMTQTGKTVSQQRQASGLIVAPCVAVLLGIAARNGCFGKVWARSAFSRDGSFDYRPLARVAPVRAAVRTGLARHSQKQKESTVGCK